MHPPIALTSYSTAVVFLPSAALQSRLNLVRSAWDKSYPRWTAHFTVLFPFCEPDRLSDAAEVLRAACADTDIPLIETEIDHVASFTMRTYKTIYLAPSRASSTLMKAAWRIAASAFGYSGREFIPHLTLGQTALTEESTNFLMSKGEALLRTDLRWSTGSFVILKKDDADGGRMKIAHVIPFQGQDSSVSVASELYPSCIWDKPEGRTATPSPGTPLSTSQSLRVATYNVLLDTNFPSAQRIPQLIRAITESNADVIALQEVSDETLSILLRDDTLRSTYKWASHARSHILPLSRNVVMLSKAHASFSWTSVQLGDKHKPAMVALFQRQVDAPLVIAVVHLSAGSSADIAAKRSREFHTLLEYLKSSWTENDWVVVGDTNFQPSDLIDIDSALEDVWDLIGAPEELGPTFDPTANVLASLTSRNDRLQKRFDRIYIRRGRFTVDDFVRFGLGSMKAPGSDHWGIAATLSVSSNISSQPQISPMLASSSHSDLQIEPTLLSDNELVEMAHRNNLILSNEDVARRSTAVESLREVICFTTASASVCIKLQPVGSSVLGVSIPSSDIDCLAVGNISSATFWRLSQERVRTLGWPNSHDIRIRRFVKDAAVQMLELEVGGIKVDVQYSCAPQVVENWENVATAPANSSMFSLPMASLRTLNAHRDSQILLSHIGSARIAAFQLAHRVLRDFFKRHGNFSSKFGYLGSFHLAILLVRVLEDLPQDVSAAQIVRKFVSHYSQWDWGANMVSLGGTTEYSRSHREAMVILSPARPSVNVAASSTRATVASIRLTLLNAEKMLSSGVSWSDICGRGIADFTTSYKTYAKIDISYWGSSSMTGRGLIGHLESRFVHLLVQLQNSVPEVHAHLWPERLSELSSEDGDPTSLQAFYLIALSGPPDRMTDTVHTRRGVLDAFVEDVRSHAKYYDPACAFLYASEVSRESLDVKVAVDTFRWPDDGIDEPKPEEDEELRTTDDSTGDVARKDSFTLDTSKKDKKQKQKRPPSTVTGAGKLRPSADVYNRLMWDPNVSSEDYVIGYEDRFLGIKEMPLGMWKREVEDEAFVPFHRVVHFRRRSDSVVVWDRASRIDLVFGSGRAQ